MSNVKSLQLEVDPGVVSLLRDLLKQAESGAIVGIVVLTNDLGNEYRRWSAGRWTAKDALYLFEHWKHEVLFRD